MNIVKGTVVHDEDSLNIAQQDTSKVNMLNDIAWRYRHTSIRQTLRYSSQAVSLASKLHYSKGVLEGSLNLANAYFKLGQLDEAFKQASFVLEYGEELGRPHYLSMALIELAKIYGEKGMRQDMRNALLRAEESLQEEDFQASIRVALYWGEYLMQEGLIQDASERLNEALLMAREQMDPWLEAKVVMAQAKLKIKLNEFSEANRYFEQAYKLLNTSSIEDIDLVPMLLQMANTRFLMTDYHQAERLAWRVLIMGKNLRNYEIQQQAYFILYSVEKLQGTSERALNLFEKYVASKDSVQYHYDAAVLHDLIIKNSVSNIKREMRQLEQTSSEDRERLYQKLAVAMLALLIVSILTLVVIRQSRRNHRMMMIQSDQRQELERFLHEKEASMRYAKRIQMALLPDDQTFFSAFPDAFVLFQPLDEVSGDFYWVTRFNGYAYLACIDCTGHGVSAAFLSVIAESLLTEIIHLKGITSPAEIMKEMHQELKRKLHWEQTKVTDGMDMGLCRYDYTHQRLIFSGAHIPLVAITSNQTTVYKGSRVGIGGLTQNGAYYDEEIPFEDNTHFYMFSDGFPDQFGGKRGKKLMRTGCIKVLEKIQDVPLNEQGSKLEDFLIRWKGRGDQIDDILIMGFQAPL
ncbi:hypothetical protein GCM10023331_31360 [Algivirga pacifica]|uniref:PPM-type phosphatase domain-containing protein n=2 Tax=Algivirga pacifica TaxID=1162670 RepID=A0ABP9DFP8_9BACT